VGTSLTALVDPSQKLRFRPPNGVAYLHPGRHLAGTSLSIDRSFAHLRNLSDLLLRQQLFVRKHPETLMQSETIESDRDRGGFILSRK